MPNFVGMNKLETRGDIELLVNTFYKKVAMDPTIGYFFTDIAKVNWDYHLPQMYSFWETLLFGQVSYKGNPMAKHFPINEIVPIERAHFDHWLKLWTETVNELFGGEMAELAIYKATNIARLMGHKMEVARKLR